MKAIIFGINGQDGFYLNEILKKEGVEVIGVSRSDGKWIKGSVADYNLVQKLIKTQQPDYVFHLAANSTTNHNALFENHETIATGTLNILENVYKFSPKTKVFISGSGLQFKNIGKPIAENDEFEARDAYSVARIQSVYAARYFRTLGLNVYVGYFFNHDSPLRTERHLNQKIVMAVKRIANGSAEKIEIGNINVKKEFNFAGDMMRAIWLLVNQENLFESVIGNGQAYSIEEWIKNCFFIINKNWKDFVIEKNDYIAEYNILVSNPIKLFNIGYSTEIDIINLAKMMVNKK